MCYRQSQKYILDSCRNHEDAFIRTCYSNRKNALENFRKHETSTAISCDNALSETSGNIFKLINENSKKVMAMNRRCFIKIIECCRVLARQNIAFQGASELNSNFRQILKFKSIGDPELTTWLSTRRYMSHDIQNEACSIMANHLSRQLMKDISPNFFSLLWDEYTDIANKQLTFCLRWVNDDLQAFEDFLGFYGVLNISANTIFSAIKDACVRLALPFDKCRGQSYDGASNMLGKDSDVAKQICDIQPRAHPTHCHAHSLNLSVKDMTTNSKLM